MPCGVYCINNNRSKNQKDMSIEQRIIDIDELIESLEYAINYGYEDDNGQIVELELEKEKIMRYSEDIYDKVYEVLRNDYNKLLQCHQVWTDVNRYYDEPIPNDCGDFHDWFSLIICTIENCHLTQKIFEFELE